MGCLIKKRDRMKKVLDFLGRDVVNTFVLVLTVILGVVSVIKGIDVGYFYVVLALFTFRFMLWHYKLWDKVNENVIDNQTRINVFGLNSVDSTKPAKHKNGYTAVSLIIFLFGIAFLIYFGISLLK